jgi:hypothetical protein
MPSLINRTLVKKLLLDTAKDTKYKQFTRVSKDTLDELEAHLRLAVIRRVRDTPSKGVTL